ncbi:MAG: hypothetical protein ACF8PN_16450 [Phycisphaerales bacterium]
MKQRGVTRSRRRGISLIESTICILIVSTMMIAALATVGSARVSSQREADQATGFNLAQGLMNEILGTVYQDPANHAGALGLESDETGGAGRANFDDIDDYHGWSARPPVDRDGKGIANAEGFTRSVTVEWVDAAEPGKVSAAETGVKRIVVTVSRDGVASTVEALRTTAWPERVVSSDQRLKVLMLVTSTSVLTAQEQARKTILESFDFIVQLESVAVVKADLILAALSADVVYYPERSGDTAFGSKLYDLAQGVVSEEFAMGVKLSLAKEQDPTDLRTDFVVTNTSHYITANLSSGPVEICKTVSPLGTLTGNTAAGLQVLGLNEETGIALALIEKSGTLEDGTPAADRRVQLPWGGLGFDINSLNATGLEILKRSLEWAGEKEQAP